jgi:hypothetical protein
VERGGWAYPNPNPELPYGGSQPPLLLSQTGQTLSVYQEEIDGSGQRFNNLLALQYMDQAQVRVKNGKAEIDVNILPPPDQVSDVTYRPWEAYETYRWDPRASTLVRVDPILDTIFAPGLTAEAIPVLQARIDRLSLVKDPAAYGVAKYLYELGLAYELTGQSQRAVETYWKLWQTVPASGYALMAKAKLAEVH